MSDYDLEATPVASGSQGSVYFAVRRSDGRPVAIKIAGPGRGAAEALRREVSLLRAVNAAGVGGVVPCLDAIEVDGRPALVMPRYAETLQAWLARVIQRPGPGTLADIFAKCAHLAWVLGRVHETAIDGGTLVHRDVKPENVFLDARGEAWIGDFGGAMAIEGLEAVELAMFGTPMWAPLDQMLPGRAIPDPTWDTYALCVLLYAALTGARPAYQSDPRTLLTPAGAELWNAAVRAIEASPHQKPRWHRAFAEARRGTTAADLIDPVGHAALVDADREVLEQGVERLGRLAGLGPEVRASLVRRLWEILSRGLSPISHPSPPNRYRSGVELGDAIEGLRLLLTPRDLGGIAPVPDLHEPPRHALGGGPPWVGIGLAALILVAGGVAAWVQREPVLRLADQALASLRPRSERVALAGGPVPGMSGVTVGPFALDGTEATVERFKRCVAAGACAPVYQPQDAPFPAVGLDRRAAEALCAWAGGRLPTEAEWRFAAGSGPMPWGDAPATCDHAVALGCGGAPLEAGAAVLGATPDGILDLAGNVWEWTSDGVLMGGSVESPASELGAAGRVARPSGQALPLSGVRCAYDVR